MALAESVSDEPAADDKADKKKKKKEKKEKKQKEKAEASGEPRKRSVLSTSLSVLVGSVFGLFLALYGILWIGPDYDLVGIAKYMPKSMLPQSYRRPYLAGKPDATGQMPQMNLQMPQRQSEPEQTTEQPAETPAPEASPEPAPSETPATETPAAEPAATEPEPAPAADRPVEPITDAPAAEKPEEMPEEPAPADAPAPEVTTPVDEAPPAPTNEKPATTPEPAAEPSPFDDAKPTEPAPSEPAPAAEPEPAEPVGPVQAASVSPEDLIKAIATAQAADRQMTAAQGTAPEADMKRIRSNFYLSMFRMADAVTFAEQDPTVEAARQQLEQFSREFATDAKRIESLKFNSARWLAFARRTTPGIMLAGKVQSCAARRQAVRSSPGDRAGIGSAGRHRAERDRPARESWRRHRGLWRDHGSSGRATGRLPRGRSHGGVERIAGEAGRRKLSLHVRRVA